MRATLCVIMGLTLLVGACRRTSEGVARLAENTRSATERLAYDSEQSSAERERRISPDTDAVHGGTPVQLVERYQTRQGPDGLFIYDMQKHEIASLDAKSQSGLTPDQASKAVDALTAADVKGVEH